MSKRSRSRISNLGLDGLTTLLLSNVWLLATCAAFYCWYIVRVIRVARNATTDAPHGAMLLVLGMRLRGNEVGLDYRRRLERAYRLYSASGARPVLIVGGPTGRGPLSEAERGRDVLVSLGVAPHDVLVECGSMDTLENLRNARSILAKQQRTGFVMITSRYHLARGGLIARGLGLEPVLCGAEERFRVTPRLVFRLLLEAYYLHWYHVGAVWSRLVGSNSSLARIR